MQFGDQDAMVQLLGSDIIFSRLIVTLGLTSAVERGDLNDFLNFHILMSTGRSLLHCEVVTRVARSIPMHHVDHNDSHDGTLQSTYAQEY